jgi:hypothetical protein
MTTTLTARSPEDLLAVVPVVLGFVPTDSVVMLTFGARSTFHARVDLPGVRDDTAEMVEALREPAVRHGVERVVFLVFSEDALPVERVARRLVRSFREAGIEVVDVLRADGRRWFPLLRSRRSVPATGVPYDVSAHPFAAQAVVDGHVTHASRDDLARMLDSDQERVARVVGVRPTAPPDDPAWVRATVLRHVRDRTSPDDEEAARLLVSVGSGLDARDAAWRDLRRDDAQHHVDLWTDLLRRAPDDLAGSAAAVLAMGAWVAGHGALSWCAVDRAQAAEPDNSLARLVADLLAAAMPPPSAWEEVPAMRDPA